jgi:Ca2+-binding EF-hand superfamily protein
LKEAFSLIDHDNDGFIDKDDLKDMYASLGQAQSDVFIEDMISEMPGPVNFTMFLTLIGEKMCKTDTEADLLEAFETFDYKKTGFINVNFIKEALSSFSDKLTDDEVKVFNTGRLYF